jgi:lipoyl-dependent peroxiredoxin
MRNWIAHHIIVKLNFAKLDCAQFNYLQVWLRRQTKGEAQMPILYTTQSTATGGRTGSAKTTDGRLSVVLDTPKELGGSGGEGTNPEQLFASGYAACFLGALKFVAAKEKVAISADSTVTATVGIGPREDGTGFGLDVELQVALPGVDKAKAEELVQAAHIVCPYSHATRGNIDVRLSVA